MNGSEKMGRNKRTWPTLCRAFAVVVVGTLSTISFATDSECTGAAVKDTGGYYCQLDANNWIPDISGTGTTVTGWKPSGCSGDDCYKLVTNIGGSFTWYGSTYSGAYISSNGYVSFGAGYTNDAGGSSVPDSGPPNNAVYAYGDDLDPSAGGSVKYQSTTCNVDRDGAGGNDHCFVVQWTNVPNIDGDVLVTVQLALDTVTDEAFVEIVSEAGAAAADHPNLVGSENGAGTVGLWYKASGDISSASATAGNQWAFTLADTVPPGNPIKMTAASSDLIVTAEWENPLDTDYAGMLVLSQTGSAVTDAPVAGTSYSLGDSIGTASVTCIVDSGDSPNDSCNDLLVSNGTTYYYKAYAYDGDYNYSSGVATTGYPRAVSSFKFAFKTSATTLAPVGAIPAAYVMGIGNDRLLQRMNETDGSRGGWVPPLAGGAVQARPLCGDLDAGGGTDYTCYVSSQNGRLYRYSADDGTSGAEATRNIAGTGGDAGCTSGLLQTSPVVMLDGFDANSNNSDDVVVVATRCGAANNKILMYSHDLATLRDSYNGGGTLGISSGAPTIQYRDSANNLVYVGVRDDGGESIVVLEVNSTPAFNVPEYAVISGIGDIDAGLAIAKKGSDRILVAGNTNGDVYVYNALVASGGSLLSLDSCTVADGCADSDGAVRGVAPGNSIAENGLWVNWIVWTTDSKVHGIKFLGDGTFDEATYWTTSIASPSAPIVLRDVTGGNDTYAYVGSSDGKLYEINATSGAVVRSWAVEAGTTIGTPTFDYNNGTNQGIVVGTTGGTYHWVKIN